MASALQVIHWRVLISLSDQEQSSVLDMQMAGDAAMAVALQEDENRAALMEAAPAPEGLEEGPINLAALHDVEVPLVGQQLPLATLLEDYEGSPRVRGNLMPLLQRFPYFRRIRGRLKL